MYSSLLYYILLLMCSFLFPDGHRIYVKIHLASEPCDLSSSYNCAAWHRDFLHCMVFCIRSHKYQVYKRHFQRVACRTCCCHLFWNGSIIFNVVGWNICMIDTLGVIFQRMWRNELLWLSIIPQWYGPKYKDIPAFQTGALSELIKG